MAEDLTFPENADLLYRMQGSVDSMSRLIEDLLESSRPGEIASNLKPIPAQTLLEDAVLTLQPLAHRSGIKLTTEAQPDLPEVLADYERVLRVFTNLVVNALKFSPRESVVRITAEPKDNAVRFCIIDKGPGIPVENLGQLFDRFWQGDSNDRRGSGLGLGIAQAIVRAHGSELTVTSEFGDGATFCFELATAE
jgi:two-component system, chemotaxis family, sensor kinase Cph1